MSHLMSRCLCLGSAALPGLVPRLTSSPRLISSFRSISSLPPSSSRQWTITPLSYPTQSRYASTSTSPTPPTSNTRRNGLIAISIGSLLLGSTFFFLYGGDNRKSQLSNGHFIPLKVLKIKSLTSDTMQFTLALPDELLPKEEEVSLVPIRSVYIMQPDLQIQRAYTVSHNTPVKQSGY